MTREEIITNALVDRIEALMEQNARLVAADKERNALVHRIRDQCASEVKKARAALEAQKPAAAESDPEQLLAAECLERLRRFAEMRKIGMNYPEILMLDKSVYVYRNNERKEFGFSDYATREQAFLAAFRWLTEVQS